MNGLTQAATALEEALQELLAVFGADATTPEAVASLAPLEMTRLGIRPGDQIEVATRRGRISLKARADAGIPKGVVFVPFCYAEAAANMLTTPALAPIGKIPEFKFCAAKVEKAASAAAE